MSILTLEAASPGIFKTPIIIFKTESISNEFDDNINSRRRKKMSNCVRIAGHAGDEFSSTMQSRYVAKLMSKLLNSSFDIVFMSFTPCSTKYNKNTLQKIYPTSCHAKISYKWILQEIQSSQKGHVTLLSLKILLSIEVIWIYTVE